MTAPLLDAAALASMRALQEANMPSEVDLIGYMGVRATGARETRTRVLLTTVPCRLVNTGASLPIKAAQPTPSAAFMLIMPIDTDSTAAELATVRGVTDGIAWTLDLVLKGEPEPRSYSATHRLLADLATVTAVTPEVVATVEVSTTP